MRQVFGVGRLREASENISTRDGGRKSLVTDVEIVSRLWIGVVFYRYHFLSQRLDGLGSEGGALDTYENDAFPGFRNAIVGCMKHLWIQHDVVIAIGSGKVALNNILHIPKANKSLDILRNKHLGSYEVYHLFHPYIELASCFLRR